MKFKNMDQHAIVEFEKSLENSGKDTMAAMDECVEELVWEARFLRGTAGQYPSKGWDTTLPEGWMTLKVRLESKTDFGRVLNVYRKLRRYIELKLKFANDAVVIQTHCKNEKMVKDEFSRRNLTAVNQ